MAQASSTAPTSEPVAVTPLHARHLALGARMVAFAGYDMPVQYPDGILKEHLWTRESAGLFDVSHMGQVVLDGPDHASVARALEVLVPADIVNLVPGRQRYSQLLNQDGGILDDLMIARPPGPDQDGRLLLVVNAACKQADHAHISALLPAGVTLSPLEERGLIALQGPKAAQVMARHCPAALDLAFMAAAPLQVAGVDCRVSRSGYTGEDGFEISVAAEDTGRLWDLLLAEAEVRPIGLGARDSLRLEAGLCLYGHDIDITTSPIEAGLAWSIQKRRRLEGGFPGAARIQRELAEGPARMRVGLRPEGRAPAREGTEIQTPYEKNTGIVTSGGFSPSLSAPIAMGYVEAAEAVAGTRLELLVRGKALPADVVTLPFVPHRYLR